MDGKTTTRTSRLLGAVRRRPTVVLAGLTIVPLLLSLPRPSARVEPAAASMADEAASEASGIISGVVRFQKEIPAPDTTTITQDESACGAKAISKTFVISDENKGLKNVLVTVEGVEGGRSATPAARDTILQKGCEYEPHFQATQMGADGIELVIRNEDGILHNIHAYMDGRTAFNTGQPGVVKELTRRVREPGVMSLECDVHGWMNAHIVFLRDQPYHSVTDGSGRFTIEGVPAGTYTLRAWHEALGEMTKEITVEEGETAEVDFVIAPKG